MAKLRKDQISFQITISNYLHISNTLSLILLVKSIVLQVVLLDHIVEDVDELIDLFNLVGVGTHSDLEPIHCTEAGHTGGDATICRCKVVHLFDSASEELYWFGETSNIRKNNRVFSTELPHEFRHLSM